MSNSNNEENRWVRKHSWRDDPLPEVIPEDVLIKLQVDDEIITVQKRCVVMSGYIKEILEEKDEEEDDEENIPIVPIENVNFDTLQHIVDYCKYHWNNRAEKIETPLKGNIESSICNFDIDFLNKFKDIEYHTLAIAANYLAITDLVYLTCAKIASLIEGKTVPEMRILTGTVDDFTEEEWKVVQKENEYFDKK